MKGTQQEAGIDGDFNPHLTGDHQIEDFGGGLKPDWARHKGFTLTKNLPSCPLPFSEPEGLLNLLSVTVTVLLSLGN